MRPLLALILFLCLSSPALTGKKEKKGSLGHGLNIFAQSHKDAIRGTVDGSKKYFEIGLDNRQPIVGYPPSACSIFELANDIEFQFTGYSMTLENKEAVDNVFAFSCKWNPTMKIALDCKYPPIGCDEMIFGWTGGSESYNYPSSVGFPAKNKLSQYVLFIVNYVEGFAGADGLTGMQLVYTENLRPDAIGFMSFGVGINAIALKPHSTSEQVSGMCPSTCLKSYFDKPVTVFNSYFHMHSLGTSAKSEIKRKNQVITLSQIDNPSSGHRNMATVNHATIEPGDEIITTCKYDTSQVSLPTLGGHAKNKEMCYNYIAYYPANPTIAHSFCGNGPVHSTFSFVASKDTETTHCFGFANSGEAHRNRLHLHFGGHAGSKANRTHPVPHMRPTRKAPIKAPNPAKKN